MARVMSCHNSIYIIGKPRQYLFPFEMYLKEWKDYS